MGKQIVQGWQVASIMAKAITEAQEKGFTKPYDIVAFIRVALDNQGLRINHKRGGAEANKE